MKSEHLRFSGSSILNKLRWVTLTLLMTIGFVNNANSQTTVVDIISNSTDHDTLEIAVTDAGLVPTLEGTGPFTVFAPTDDAFALLGSAKIDELLADPTGELADILKYHVVEGNFASGDLSDGQVITSLNGDSLKVTIDGSDIYIDGAQVTGANNTADNGVVHIIDAVLIPYATVVDVIVGSNDHTTLETAVIEAELAATLSGEGPFTVFAPTDAAFDALDPGLLTSLLDDPTGDLADILKYHVVNSYTLSGDLTDGQMITTLNGDSLTVTIDGTDIYIDSALVIGPDIETDNGVVHVIDSVMMPYSTVVDVVVGSNDHTTLEIAVIEAELASTLSGEGPFTVFAPTDAAFDALDPGVLTSLLDDPTGDLADILKYHVFSGNVLSGDLIDGQTVEMLEGTDAIISLIEDMAYINQAMITVKDITTNNGVVHVIDAVITQPTSIVDIVVNSPRHNTLETAVLEAELADALSAAGAFTLFAPTDAAFDEIGNEVITTLLADATGYLAEILKYHAVGATALSGDLSDGDIFTTLKGYDIDITINQDGIFVNDAEVIFSDYEAPNGVVHVIDAVMLPPADVQIAENQDYGSILTDLDGNTLYFFTPDADGTSACVEGCLDNWPIFYQPSAVGGEGLNSEDFSTIDRGDGTMQTTYKGWPLYYFVNDAEAGQTNGEGLVDKWYVAKPDYSIMLADNQLVGADGNNYTSDYTVGEEVIQYFTDSEGNTLYTWMNDRFNKNNFTAEDFANNAAWPIYEQSVMSVPSALNADDFGTIDVYGKTQMTYKGNPLYYYGSDINRGETKGVSIPTPGVWPVATASTMMPEYATVVDIVVNSDDHTTLETAVIEAELAETLSGTGPFTVFAPTDAAFAELGDETLTALLADPTGDLADILKYHVVSGKVMSDELTDGQMITTLNGDSLTVTINETGVYIDDAMVTAPNLEADNGVVHVINGVVTPYSTVVDIVFGSNDHTTLETAVIAAELAETLSGTGPFTVFAPTDEAFAALGEETLTALLAEPTGDLADILKYHVVSGKVMSDELVDGQMITTLNGDSLTVTIDETGVYIDDAMVTTPDIEADNGVVHVINGVVTPYSTVVDVVVGSNDHTILETAVIAAQLAETLSGTGPFTVFAPTDAAFEALGSETITALLDDPTGALSTILQYHVVNGSIESTDLSDGQIVEMLEGTDAFISLYDDMAFINQAKITTVNIVTDNGVVHVIDAVITQPESIVDIVVNSPRHTILETAVIAAELAGTLSGDGPFTLFAPTDAAFAALGETTINTLLADPTGELADILKYHVVGSKALSSDLSDGTPVETLQGQSVEVSISEGVVKIDDAIVVFANYEAPNGVVHVIDAVIQPTPTGIKENSELFINTSVYPNPAIDRINFRFDLVETAEVSIEVFDMIGQKVIERNLGTLTNGIHDYTISTESMESGIYIFIVNSGNSRFANKVKVVR